MARKRYEYTNPGYKLRGDSGAEFVSRLDGQIAANQELKADTKEAAAYGGNYTGYEYMRGVVHGLLIARALFIQAWQSDVEKRYQQQVENLARGDWSDLR